MPNVFAKRETQFMFEYLQGKYDAMTFGKLFRSNLHLYFRAKREEDFYLDAFTQTRTVTLVEFSRTNLNSKFRAEREEKVSSNTYLETVAIKLTLILSRQLRKQRCLNTFT